MIILEPKPATSQAYKHVGPTNLSIDLDLYLPTSTSSTKGASLTLPAVVYFHPGGLIAGDKTWLPKWLLNRVMSLGYAFISANYRLIPPRTVHEVIEDITDLFIFLDKAEIPLGDGRVFKSDMTRLGVAGSSGGGYCAYLAAIHCSPEPKALFCMSAMGGSVFTPHYLKVKTAPFWRGRSLIDPAPFKNFLYPFPGGPIDPISDSPETPTNTRGSLVQLYFQLAIILDHYTGLHEPSLTEKLREVLKTNSEATSSDFAQVIPVAQRDIFPELNVSSSEWPPTLLIHGDADTAVLISESQNMAKLLAEAGVDASLTVASGQEHLFDMEVSSEERWGKEYDTVKEFFLKHLGKP